MAFKIDKNIPVPSNVRGPRAEFPFEEMELNDSIFVPGATVKKLSGQLSYYKNKGMNFTLRAMKADVLDEETGDLRSDVDGVRIWKIDPALKSNQGRKKASAQSTAVASEEAATAPSPEAGENDPEPVVNVGSKKSSKKANSNPTAEPVADPGNDEGEY